MGILSILGIFNIFNLFKLKPRLSVLGMVKTYSMYVFSVDFVHFLIFTYYSIIMAMIHTVFPPSKKEITGKISVVVGSSRGVGREVALRLAELKSQVICIDNNVEGNEETVKQVKAKGGAAFPFTCDVTDPEQVEKILTTAQEEVGPIDIQFHCFGVPSQRSFTNEPPPPKSVIDLGVTAHLYLMDAILPTMKTRRTGHVVLLTSVAGASGLDNQIPTEVSQFAVQGLFEAVNQNLRLDKSNDVVRISLAHVYPFMVSKEHKDDPSMKMPNFFGSIDAKEAAEKIVDGMLRNQTVISLPKYTNTMGNICDLLPRRSKDMLREFLDMGIDF